MVAVVTTLALRTGALAFDALNLAARVAGLCQFIIHKCNLLHEAGGVGMSWVSTDSRSRASRAVRAAGSLQRPA